MSFFSAILDWSLKVAVVGQHQSHIHESMARIPYEVGAKRDVRSLFFGVQDRNETPAILGKRSPLCPVFKLSEMYLNP